MLYMILSLLPTGKPGGIQKHDERLWTITCDPTKGHVKNNAYLQIVICKIFKLSTEGFLPRKTRKFIYTLNILLLE